MKEKVATASRVRFNGNGEVEHFDTQSTGNAPSPLLLSNETEVENVAGYSDLNDPAADIETFNPSSANENAFESFLEESGSTAEADEALLDAFYASYPLPAPTVVSPSGLSAEAMEVIIGTDNRVRINPTTAYPWRAICGLKLTAADGTRWIGTGWLVSPRTIITAGHCVFMKNQGGWIRSAEVIPGLNNALRPFGSFVGTSLRSVKGWTQDGKREFDYGAIILPPSSRPGDKTGYFGYAVRDDSYLGASTLNLSGYPGDKNNGNEQWFMSMRPKSLSSRVITYNIDTMGGQSGAPVWVKVGTQRYCVGIHTNGHLSGNSATRIVKPVFDNIKNWKALGM